MASAYIHLSRWSGKCLYTSEQMEWQMEWQVPIYVRVDGVASAYIHLSRWSGKCLYTSEQMEWQVPIYI